MSFAPMNCSTAARMTAAPVMAKVTMSDRLSTTMRRERERCRWTAANLTRPKRRGHHCSSRTECVGFRRLSPLPMLDLAAVRRARQRITGRVHVTPTVSATRLGERVGVQLVLKCENLQKTGSFKVRGALNKLSQLSAEERERGVVTVSAGNHAQALAWAARAAGVHATVVMYAAASPTKVEASRGYGAEVVLYGASGIESFARARELERERGL